MDEALWGRVDDRWHGAWNASPYHAVPFRRFARAHWIAGRPGSWPVSAWSRRRLAVAPEARGDGGLPLADGLDVGDHLAEFLLRE